MELRDVTASHLGAFRGATAWRDCAGEAASSSVLAFDHQEMHVSKCSSKNDSVLHSFAYRDNSPLLEAHGVQELATLIKGRHIRL